MARKWWMLIGAVVVFVVVFNLLEKLVGPRSAPAADAAGVAREASPEPPRILRPEGGGVEIRHDFLRRTTIRLGSPDDEQALADCLTKGIEQAFAGGTEGWDRARVREETQRVQDRCMPDLHGIRVPPPPER